MRGKQIQLAGSVFARPNGRFTAVTPPVPERFTGRKRRTSLGTAQLGHSPAVLLGTYARDLDAAKRHVAVSAVTAQLFGFTSSRVGGETNSKDRP